MDVLGSLVIAFSMYSRIPMPEVTWTEERMRYAMCFFPLVGIAVGAVVIGLHLAFTAMGFPVLAWLLPVAAPLIVTGGIHMDGFLDVADAKASHGSREERLRIMKDPHLGAFAVIACALYLMVYAALWGELEPVGMKAVGAVFVVSRALSGLAVVSFPMAKKDGLAASFAEQAKGRVVRACMAVYLLLCGVYLGYFAGWTAAACAVASGCFFGYYYRMSLREFGGITGDLAGYFLQMCELLLLAVLVFF